MAAVREVPRSRWPRGTRIVWGGVYERTMLIDYREIGRKGRNCGRFERAARGKLAAARGDLASSPAAILQVEAGEAGLDVERMVNDALALVTNGDYPCPSYRPPARRHAAGEERP